MNLQTTKLTLAAAAALIFFSPAIQAEDGNWADTLKNMGKVYSDKDSPFIQEVKFFGRAHYQWNYSDGESDGEDFSGNGDELRRLRLGTSVKLLDGFKILGRANMEKGGFRNTSLGYTSFDELYVDYSKDGLFGFDSASIGYGRYKVAFGGEEHVSSKKIKTVERSGLNNRFGSLRPTGVVLNAEKNEIAYTAGIYSTESDSETWADWDGGTAFQGSVEFPAADGSFIIDFMYADDSDNNGSIFDFDYATSLSYNRSFGDVNLLTNFTYGDTGSEDIYGFVILPTVALTEKLEAAFRLQWADSSGASDVSKSSSSRGIRRVARNDGFGTGAGDSNITLYAGLNYYLSGDYAKFMTGIEYEKIDGDVGRDLKGFTLWTAFRTYF